jgi:predicted nucleotide-binding protein (sugar kinase/HSP70/actin superfamily)
MVQHVTRKIKPGTKIAIKVGRRR